VNWEAALASYDRDLRARGSAERTRRAYGVDLGGFAEWAGEQGLGPIDVRHRDVRRFGAGLSNAGAAPATVARKLAAIRGLYGYLVRTERAGSNPAELVSSPKRSEKLPNVLTTEQMRSLLERIPARTPLELRDRAMLELAYSCGLRCEEIVNLDEGALDFETEQLRVLGKGSKERLLPVGEPGQLSRERPPRPRHRSARAGPLPLEERTPPLQLRRDPPSRSLDPRGRACGRSQPTFT
jgi:site-specific recombinase XerD